METSLIAKNINPVTLFSEKGLDPVLEEIKQKIKEFVPEVETPKGRKSIASFAYKIAQSKTFIDNAGKSLVEKQKAQIKLIDSERKRARDFLDEQKILVRKPLTDWEEAEKERIAAEEARIVFEKDFDDAIAENDLIDRQREIERKEAELARIEEERRIEQERIEREAREKKEREDLEARLKKEAEEKAKIDAERAIREANEKLEREREESARKEREAKEAAEKAERDRIAAEERAKIEKEIAIKKAKDEADAKHKADKEAEEKRIADARAIEDKKAANKKHQAEINNKICEKLMAIGLTKDQSKAVVCAVVKGEVPAMVIRY